VQLHNIERALSVWHNDLNVLVFDEKVNHVKHNTNMFSIDRSMDRKQFSTMRNHKCLQTQTCLSSLMY